VVFNSIAIFIIALRTEDSKAGGLKSLENLKMQRLKKNKKQVSFCVPMLAVGVNQIFKKKLSFQIFNAKLFAQLVHSTPPTMNIQP
jgi:hypothetical protein